MGGWVISDFHLDSADLQESWDHNYPPFATCSATMKIRDYMRVDQINDTQEVSPSAGPV